VKLAIETHGTGQPLVLIHGMGSAATAWQPIIPTLAKQFSVVTIDLPGHGRTPYSPIQKMDPTSLAQLVVIQKMDPTSLAQLVVKNLKNIGIESFHLVGNSLGGWVSFEIAALYPTAVKSITALAPAGLWLTPFTSRYPGELALRVMASGVEKLAPSLLNYTWAKKIGFETVSPRWKELSYEICLDATSAMAQSTGYFPAWDALLGKRFDKQIDPQIPITIVFGDSDHTWIILPQTGHAPMWDSPNEVISEILHTVGVSH